MFKNANNARQRHHPLGFSMIEIMVVVVVMIALITILIPVLTGVGDDARIVAAKSTMATISLALGSYKTDFGDYPPSRIWDDTSGRKTFGVSHSFLTVDGGREYQGAELLAQALAGPAPETGGSANPSDGLDGYGWKGSDRKSGKIYGPYLAMGGNDSILAPRFDANGDSLVNNGESKNDQTGSWETGTGSEKQDVFVLTTPGSEYARPILYYRANSARGRRVRTGAMNVNNNNMNGKGNEIWGYGDNATQYQDNVPRFDLDHNNDNLLMKLDHNNMDEDTELEQPAEFFYAIKDTKPAGDLGVVHPEWLERRQQFERSLRQAEFLMVGAGPDDVFGVVDEYVADGSSKNPLKDSDDIYVTGP
jgi:type II secretory pathway pseudopilin PulG